MRTKANVTGWTDERIEQLRKLWGSGLSAAQIAMTLGGVNRNGVIGKAHRLGLSNPKRVQPVPKRAEPGRLRNPTRLVVIRNGTDPGLPKVQSAAPSPGGVAFMDLERHHCRWPVDAQFCGADAVESKPYCGRHLRMAYQ